jgi:hypothetical protein
MTETEQPKTKRNYDPEQLAAARAKAQEVLAARRAAMEEAQKKYPEEDSSDDEEAQPQPQAEPEPEPEPEPIVVRKKPAESLLTLNPYSLRTLPHYKPLLTINPYSLRTLPHYKPLLTMTPSTMPYTSRDSLLVSADIFVLATKAPGRSSTGLMSKVGVIAACGVITNAPKKSGTITVLKEQSAARSITGVRSSLNPDKASMAWCSWMTRPVSTDTYKEQ